MSDNERAKEIAEGIVAAHKTGTTSEEAFIVCSSYLALLHDYEVMDSCSDKAVAELNAANKQNAKLEEAVRDFRDALEVVASNGAGRGMGWTPAEHSRRALSRHAKNKGE